MNDWQSNTRPEPAISPRLRYGAVRVTAERDLKKIWQPDGVWREYVNALLKALGQVPM